jgi:hypothetical protein
MLASSSTLVRERNPVFLLQGYVTESQFIITTLLMDISWAFGFCVVTRFNPGNAHVCGLLRHGAYVGSSELDGDQMKAEGHEVLPRFSPLGRVMTYVLLV